MVQMMAAVLIAYKQVPTTYVGTPWWTCITKEEGALLHRAPLIQQGIVYGSCTPPRKKPWWEI